MHPNGEMRKPRLSLSDSVSPPAGVEFQGGLCRDHQGQASYPRKQRKQGEGEGWGSGSPPPSRHRKAAASTAIAGVAAQPRTTQGAARILYTNLTGRTARAVRGRRAVHSMTISGRRSQK